MLQQANAETGGSEFGAVLRHRRAAAGLTQEQLAERSGLSVRTISNLERGRTGRPYRASAELLAQALRLADAEATQFIAVARGSVGNDQSSSGWDDETLRVATAPDWLLVPRQLPAGPPHFTGRSGELEMLSRMLDRTTGSDGLPIVAISGSAGVGKTALAVHWAHRAAVRFPDGQLYVDLRGFGPSATPTGHADAVRGLLGTLGVPPDRIPADPDAQGALYRSLLAGRRLLIVLDNAHDEAQVRPLLPGTPGCMVLVTSRRDLIGLAAAEGARTVKLDVLSPAEAGLLLARRLGEHRTRAELAATAELGRLCARLPLALAIVAARAAACPHHPLAAMATELSDARNRLDMLDTGDTSTGIRAAFSWSCRRLSDLGAHMFRRLGLHPGPDITATAAASLAGVTSARARDALRELTAANLLAESAHGRYIMHDLLRIYAAEQARIHHDESECHAIMHRRPADTPRRRPQRPATACNPLRSLCPPGSGPG